jgi:hypothetical protein
MQLGGIPNDAIPTINPIACIVLRPLMQKGLYPALTLTATVVYVYVYHGT